MDLSVHWLVSLAQMESSKFSERFCLKNSRGEPKAEVPSVTPQGDGGHAPFLWCQKRNAEAQAPENSRIVTKAIGPLTRNAEAERSTWYTWAKADECAKETIKRGWRQGTEHSKRVRVPEGA